MARIRLRSDGIARIAVEVRCRVMECQGSEVTAHKVTLPSAPWREPVASRDGSRKQRMKNEGCVEFWWDGGTGSVITRSSQHALCRLITIGREVCGAFDYMSQQRPLGVLLVGWHHLHSSDLGSALMSKTQVAWIFLRTRGCSPGKTNEAGFEVAAVSRLRCHR